MHSPAVLTKQDCLQKQGPLALLQFGAAAIFNVQCCSPLQPVSHQPSAFYHDNKYLESLR